MFKIANRSFRRLNSCIPVFLLLYTLTVNAQIHPVQVTPQLVPPYSVYLSDYATAGSDKLRVIVVQRDLSKPAYQVRLSMTVEWNNKVIMRTARTFNPAPLNLNPGVPMIISGVELAPYLDSRNIDFVGYDRNQYERTKALPEGQYRISFIAYDYYRQDVQVSAEGNAFYFLVKNEPPLINFPACGTKISTKTPQQIVFSWLPRNTSSPNSALETEYEFSLYETRPTGRNPNDVVLTSQPVFSTRTNISQLIYGPGEPMLLQDMTYVWRVRAIDINGRDAFRNNGYSEVCTFYYGGTDMSFEIGVVKDLQAQSETKTRGRISWTSDYFDSYRVEYKKVGAQYEWFRSTTDKNELKVFDLEPDSEYEARVQAKKSGYHGPYCEIVKFRTQPNLPAECGENPDLPDTSNPGNPLENMIPGTIVNARGVDMAIIQVTPLEQPGWYKGIGQVTLDYFLGLSYGATFDRIYINENRDVIFGRINIISEGMAVLIQEQIAANKEKQEKKEKSDTTSTSSAHDASIEISIVGIISSVEVNADGKIEVTDSRGNVVIYDRPIDVSSGEPKIVVITDNDGNSYSIDKDGDVSCASCPNSLPGSNQKIDSASLDDFGKLLLSVIEETIDGNNKSIDSHQKEFSKNKTDMLDGLKKEGYETFLYTGLNDEYASEGMSKKFKQPTEERIRMATGFDLSMYNMYKCDVLILKLREDNGILTAMIEPIQFLELEESIKESVTSKGYPTQPPDVQKSILFEEVQGELSSKRKN